MPERRSIEPANTLFERMSPWLPWLVLFVCLTMTTIATWLLYRSESSAEQMRFDSYSTKLTDQVVARLKSYERLMAAAGGFVVASEDVTPEEWRAFVGLQGLADFPGASGIGLVVPVHETEVAAFSDSMRQHFPEYLIKNRGTRSFHYIVKYIEPIEPNKEALGVDATHDPARTEAFDRACEIGLPTMTRRVLLKQPALTGPSTLYVFPIFSKGIMPATSKERRDNLIGWVYLPLSMNDVMSGISRELSDQIDFELYHGDAATAENLLYDADGDASKGLGEGSPPYAEREFHATRTISIGGQKWTLMISNREAFNVRPTPKFPWHIAVPGVVVSILCAALINAMSVSRHRARVLAADMTRDLRASEERYRLLVDNVHDTAGIILDASGNIATWNMGATRLFGHTEKEALGQPLSLFFSAEDVTDGEPQLRLREAKTNGSCQFEGWRFRKDGSRFWGYASISPLRETDGSLRGFAMLTRDMTERKINEEARAKVTQQLEIQNAELAKARDVALASVKAKTEFLANMSHEIRTPMTSILGYSDLLLQEADQMKAPDQCIDAINSIRRNGAHLLSIINDILDVSKIDAGQVALQSVSVSPVSAIEEILSLMNVRAVGKGLLLQTEIQYPIPAVIHTDPIRLRQVLVNLVGNAIKFTNAGSVTLRLSYSRADSSLLFQIADTGIGIDSADHLRIFEPFAQVDASASRRFSGTGLGLHISRRLADILGGTITVQSAIGQGSTFSFHLPLAAQAASLKLLPGPAPHTVVDPQSPVPADEHIEGHILLAEDGPDNQRLFAFLLRRAGAQVTVASNGIEAVDAVRLMLNRGPQFHLILMDMQMPEMDGYAATRAIRSLGVQIPIIALTAHAMAGDREACIHAGCTDYMTKPIDHAHLIALCKKYLPAEIAK